MIDATRACLWQEIRNGAAFLSAKDVKPILAWLDHLEAKLADREAERDEWTNIAVQRGLELEELRAGWRCFHCDEVFLTIDAAREHFGPHELADPACQIDIAKFREMENYFARCCAEDSDSERSYHAKEADHARSLIDEEQKGFDRGLRAQLEKVAHGKTCPYCERTDPTEKEVPALYGQYDDEGNPLWMDGAVRQLFALRAALEKARGEMAQIDSALETWFYPGEAMRAKCEEIAQAEYEKYNAKMQAQPHKAHWSDMADAAGIIADRIAALKGKGETP